MSPGETQVWQWLAEVPDPELPMVSIIDLGIVREVAWEEGGECVVTVTPTYSGCPAMPAIAESIRHALSARGVGRVSMRTRLSPAWTTDWMSEPAKETLKAGGIAPPMRLAGDWQTIDIGRLRRDALVETGLCCPRCDSARVRLLSQFGSTPCKALYQCEGCREPFEHFKCH